MHYGSSIIAIGNRSIEGYITMVTFYSSQGILGDDTHLFKTLTICDILLDIRPPLVDPL